MNLKKSKKTYIDNLDRWLWLLYRTIQENNWKFLHQRLLTDNSDFRELSNMLHHIEDPSNNIPLSNPVRQNIAKSIGSFKVFRENFAIHCYMKGFASKEDVRLIISMVNRTIHFREFEVELMDLVKDSFNKWKKDSNIADLDQAFQLKPIFYEDLPANPYNVPHNVERLVSMIIDDNISMKKSIEKLNREATNHLLKTTKNRGLWRTANDLRRPSIWDDVRWESEIHKYKWAALNNYLIDRVIKGKQILGTREMKVIRNNWDEINIPSELIVYPSLVNFSSHKNSTNKRLTSKPDKELH